MAAIVNTLKLKITEDVREITSDREGSALEELPDDPLHEELAEMVQDIRQKYGQRLACTDRGGGEPPLSQNQPECQPKAHRNPRRRLQSSDEDGLSPAPAIIESERVLLRKRKAKFSPTESNIGIDGTDGTDDSD